MKSPATRLSGLVTRGTLFAAIVLLSSVPAATADSLTDALTEGKVLLDWRTRAEFVDQDGFAEDAEAFTTRFRLGYRTGDWHDFFVLGELEANEAFGGEKYDSTQNGKTDLPRVDDPEDAEINRAFIGYRGVPNTIFKLGRQRIILDNHRFLGNVGWRQLEQTFDSFTASAEIHGHARVFYGYINNVNRIFGESNPNSALADRDHETHLVNVAYETEVGTIVGYGYFIDNEDVPMGSHRNLGVRFSGSTSLTEDWGLVYAGEYADQADYEDGASIIDADYTLAEMGVKVKKVTAKLGYELLSGDGTYGFRTPLATLHKFNGWADKFLITPLDGLEDIYVLVSGSVKKFNLTGVYHDFSSDAGSMDYGTEIDFQVTRSFGKIYSAGAKFALYDSDGFAQDTDKYWLWCQLKF